MIKTLLDLSSFRNITGCIVLILISSCATPIAPSGGQPDRSGPKLIGTIPASGTTQFNSDEIRFQFEDWVDRSSFQRAFSIEPGLNIDYDIKWRRKTAVIKLKSTLPDSTTIIFSLDNNLRDTRSNRITQPIRVAVSTGNVIDQASVSFKVIPAFPLINKTEPVILLYRDPFNISEPALYVSSADTSGVIRFNYLAEGEYKAILVHDINRNRLWDRDREFAQPMATQTITTSAIDTSAFIPFYYAKRDTTRPFVQTIGQFSSRRLRIQFSKPIPFNPNNHFVLEDSLGNSIRVNHLYSDTRDQSVSFFQTVEALSETNIYLMTSANLRDSNGNTLRIRDTMFEGSSDTDTTQVRFIAPFGGDGLSGQDSLYLRYSTVLNDSVVMDSLKIYSNREDARNNFNITSELNRLIVSPKNRWNPSNTYQIRAWDPSTALYKDVRVQLVDNTEAGELSIKVSDSLSIGQRLQLILFQSNGAIYRQTAFTDSVTIGSIRPGAYHLLIHNSESDGRQLPYGSVDPFDAPGFIYSDPRFPIRARMSSELILD